MNPVLPLAALLPLLVLLGGLAIWLSWRAIKDLAGGVRSLILALRVVGVLLLAGLLLNPGRWIAEKEEVSDFWAVLFDQSGSMAEEERAAEAGSIYKELKSGQTQEGRVRPWVFAKEASELTGDAAALPTPALEGSDFVAAVGSVLENSAARGQPLTGVLVVGDGRQTALGNQDSAVVARAQALGVPVHVLPLGGEVQEPRVEIASTRSSVLAFAEQSSKVSAKLKSRFLPASRVTVTLENLAGEKIASQEVEVEGEQEQIITLDAIAPAESTVWRWRVQAPEGMDHEPQDDLFQLRVLDSRTRVFLAEGAPYWDSKFLAQHLRLQDSIDLNSVHRLSNTRWFRIDSGGVEEEFTSEATSAIFPDEDLGRYDLVVFGKNIAPFLNDERVEALERFVRDQGGAVLFSRGKAFSGTQSPLSRLEPVVWDVGGVDEFRFRPTEEGAAVGLFGEGLPGIEAAVWGNLPALKDGSAVAEVKPFTRVLAEGQPDGLSGNRLPLLLVRRYGQGVCGMVNADGLWKWDFYPEAKEQGNMYAEFWTQLVQWMATWSEFLPGQDYALRLGESRAAVGEEVAVWVTWRGEGVPEPRLKLIAPDGSSTELTPGLLPGESGRPRWRGSLKVDQPGWWQVEVMGEESQSLPTTGLMVIGEPREDNELSADAGALTRFASATGGKTWKLEEVQELLEEINRVPEVEDRDGGMEWQSWLRHWAVVLLGAGVFGWEWWLRRRNGLV